MYHPYPGHFQQFLWIQEPHDDDDAKVEILDLQIRRVGSQQIYVEVLVPPFIVRQLLNDYFIVHQNLYN